jgi:hypothetical protein
MAGVLVLFAKHMPFLALLKLLARGCCLVVQSNSLIGRGVQAASRCAMVVYFLCRWAQLVSVPIRAAWMIVAGKELFGLGTNVSLRCPEALMRAVYGALMMSKILPLRPCECEISNGNTKQISFVVSENLFTIFVRQ